MMSKLGVAVYAVAVDRNEIDEWGPAYLGLGAAFTGIGALIGRGVVTPDRRSVTVGLTF